MMLIIPAPLESDVCLDRCYGHHNRFFLPLAVDLILLASLSGNQYETRMAHCRQSFPNSAL
ncbi:hypothetical protein, partial [Thiolapillus sp.]